MCKRVCTNDIIFTLVSSSFNDCLLKRKCLYKLLFTVIKRERSMVDLNAKR